MTLDRSTFLPIIDGGRRSTGRNLFRQLSNRPHFDGSELDRWRRSTPSACMSEIVICE